MVEDLEMHWWTTECCETEVPSPGEDIPKAHGKLRGVDLIRFCRRVRAAIPSSRQPGQGRLYKGRERHRDQARIRGGFRGSQERLCILLPSVYVESESPQSQWRKKRRRWCQALFPPLHCRIHFHTFWSLLSAPTYGDGDQTRRNEMSTRSRRTSQFQGYFNLTKLCL